MYALDSNTLVDAAGVDPCCIACRSVSGHCDANASVAKPWYFEAGQGRYFNSWSVTHVLWGALSRRMNPLAAIGLHTLYEAVEGELFPIETRDTSVENHVGDTISFLIGRFLL